MSAANPAISAPRRSVVPRGVTESLLLAARGLWHVRRMPERLLDVTLQPVLFVLLFAYVFGSAIGLPGGGSYREYLVSGMLAQTICFASASMSMGVCADMQESVIDRFRSLPIRRGSVLAGRVLAELVQTVLGVVVTGGTGALIGWRIHNGAGNILECVGIITLFAFSISWLGAFFGTLIRSPEAAQGVFFMTVFPLTFASGIFVPIAGMTPWLRDFAQWNPVTALALSIRRLLGNPTGTLHPTWASEHAILLTVIWSLGFLVTFLPLAIRSYFSKVSR